MTFREVNVSLCRSVSAAVIRSGVQRVFLNRLNRARKNVRHVVVISPWISTTFEPSCPFIMLVGLIRERRIPSYFITRRPENIQQSRAVDILRSCPTVELIHNDNVHAKLYVCRGPSPHGFALVSSANLTTNSLNLYEIGLLVIGVGAGSYIVEELGSFGTQHLRTRPESEVVKKIDVRSLRNVV